MPVMLELSVPTAVMTEQKKDRRQVNKKILRIKGKYRDGVKRTGDKIGMGLVHKHITVE